MTNEVLFVLLGLLLAFQVGMMFALRRCEALLTSFNLDLVSANPEGAVEAMREEVGGLVEDVLSSMRPPTIADHLGGVLAQWAQMKMMREFQASGVLPNAVEDSIDAGAPLD
jgi:hypothetical protein